MVPTADTTRRLIYIRLLLGRAEEQARLSPPFSGDSINRLHDVAEMFLALAATVHQVKIPPNLLDYWELLKGPLARNLSYHSSMQKFNKVRVALKHYGVQPSEQEIQAAVAAVRGLLYDECEDLLGVALENVSLLDLVTETRSRKLLESAEQNWQGANVEECFADLSQAFTALVEDYKGRKKIWYGMSVFDTAKDLRRPAFSDVDRDQERFEEDITKALKSIDFTISLLALGVDLRRHGKFTSLVPDVRGLVGGGRHVFGLPGGGPRTQDDYEFCVDFIVTTAVHLSDFDYDFDHWETRRKKLSADPT